MGLRWKHPTSVLDPDERAIEHKFTKLLGELLRLSYLSLSGSGDSHSPRDQVVKLRRALLRKTEVRLSQLPPVGPAPGFLLFACNICGQRTSANLMDVVDREKPSCGHCRSSLRFRALIAALQERLLGEIIPLRFMPERKDITGLGLSDESLYSVILEEKFNYTNTFYHKEPYLDITKPSAHFQHQFDFVITSDVMEHVQPPIESAFQNLHALLRPSGLLVLTVPFASAESTVEHFPELHDFRIVGSGRDRTLVNTTRAGEKQTFNNLIFHGGQGATLEMRTFSEAGLLELMRHTGFRNLKVHRQSLPQCGIVNLKPFSLPITAIAV